jgi:hypothetical protein
MLDEIASLAPLTFQQLCAELLQRRFPGFRAVDGSGGDEGVDAWVPDTRTYFQFHAPMVRVRRDKFARYLAQATNHNPAKWVFVTNRDFTRSQWRWFDVLAQSVSFPIETWGGTKLSDELKAHPDLVVRYLQSVRTGSRTINVGTQRAQHISNIAAESVNYTVRGQTSRPRIFVSGVVANEPTKLGYLKYLVHLFNEYKERQIGKVRMRYPIVSVQYRKAIGYTVPETPLEKFVAAQQYLQQRIKDSKVGRIKRAKGEKMYDTFEEYLAR